MTAKAVTAGMHQLERGGLNFWKSDCPHSTI